MIAYIHQHEDDDVRDLLLKHKEIEGVPASFVARQIQGRQKAKQKLPSFHSNPLILYPPAINIEQSSSEITASFKREFLRDNLDGFTSGADLTGGLGVDTLHLAALFRDFAYVEPQPDLFALTRHNLDTLGARNITYINTNAEDFLANDKSRFDLVFIDPSRRIAGSRRVFSLRDCEPDITLLQEAIFERSKTLLVKASPLLDIRQGVREIQFVSIVCIVAVDNECRELIFFSREGEAHEPEIRAVHIQKQGTSVFSFRYSEEQDSPDVYAEPSIFIYEPNPAIMKAGAFRTISKRYPVQKLHPNTHLYTSSGLVNGFPGRVFRSKGFVHDSNIHEFFPDNQANVSVRNYPLTAEELKKRMGLKDGGNRYLIGLTHSRGRALVAAERIY